MSDARTAVGRLPEPSAREIAAMLRTRQQPAEGSFDRFLPDRLRAASSRHWTPLVVALRVAEWLDELGIRTVVDLGSGAGKFCVAAALAGHARLTGIEQRPWLVEAARDLAREFEVDDRVEFIQGVLGNCAVPEADAYYLFNPFGENLFGPDDHVDDEVVVI
jgi:predicted RNA methylase